MHSSDPLFLKGEEWILITSLGGGREIWKIFKSGWKYGARAGLLKKRPWNFCYLIFSRFIVFTLRNYFTLCKIVLCIWRKMLFFCQHDFMKKSRCLKINLYMCKEDWCVKLRQEGDSLREGGRNCLKYVKTGWDRKQGSRNKNLNKRGPARLRSGWLKKEGLEPPYELWYGFSVFFRYGALKSLTRKQLR